ncbi:MAG: alpha/beta fold hydrolase [Steroidobacteraceae bacterium]
MRMATGWCVAATFAGLIMTGSGAAQTPVPSPRPEEGFITTPDGLRLYYRKVGDSPRVVVQPGRLFAFADFEWLGEHFTLISYDMRNRGRSELVADDSRISFEHDVADLETVRRHFGVERMALMGYSYLGKIVALYSLEHASRVERIVQFGAVAPNFGTEYRPEFVFRDDPVDPAARARLRAMRNEQSYHLTHPREYCREEWSVAHLPSLVGDPARADRVRIDVCDMPNEWPVLQARHLRLHFEESGMTHRTPLDAVRQLQVPVLTVHGTRDRNAPYGAGREWAYLLPDARLLTVEGAGHHAFGEVPEFVMPAVKRFLDGAWPDGAVKVTEDPRRQ